MFPSVPPATKILIIANVAVFLLETVAGGMMFALFALWPLTSGFLPWQIVTYAFLHAGLTHLLLNMFALYMFGGEIERVVGQRRYLTYYFVCVLSAAAAQLAVTAILGGAPYPTVGASGGVFGVLLAFAMYFPRRTILLIIPPIPMPAWLFVTLFGILELYFGVTGTQAGVAHFAHLGGMVGGYLMIRRWRGRPPFGRRRF
ncbi:MAG: rhomboid family intramembrane serine protease [Betaproteobacteria bacterium]|jgi:membrane associated rhomboid family serine protease|nr:rhomboid family intramembrane serine protease [Betaproteobacteria bacterium]